MREFQLRLPRRRAARSQRRAARSIAAWLLGAVLVVLLLSNRAFAQGNGGVDWANTQWQEQRDAWRLELTVRLPKLPDSPDVPLRFEFVPTAYFERSLVDADDIVERRIPLQAQQPLVEALDVRFIAEQSGQLSQHAKLRFVLSRGRGFEAGEYAVLVRDARSGEALAGPQTLTLQGNNPIIDRRPIAFDGAVNAPVPKPLPKAKPRTSTPPKAKPTTSTTGEPEEAPSVHSAAMPSSEAAPLSAGAAPTGDSPSPPKAPFSATPLVPRIEAPLPSQERPESRRDEPARSCACEVAPSQFSLLAAVPWLGTSLLFYRRRQRRAKRRAPLIL